MTDINPLHTNHLMEIQKKWACTFMMIGTLLLAISVMLGAFGAHALKNYVDATYLAIWDTAVHYQQLHSVGLLFLGVLFLILKNQTVTVRYHLISIGFLFLTGIIFFSGSLYLLVLTGQKILGAFTPIGGALFILGWIMLLLAILRLRRTI